MEAVDILTEIYIIQRVHDEEQKILERLRLVVHPDQEMEIRSALERAGYDKLQVIGNHYVPTGHMYFFQEPEAPDWLMEPEDEKLPLWKRITGWY